MIDPAEIENVLSAIVRKSDAELLALSEAELAAQWYWVWKPDRSAAWNTYQFNEMLELHKRRCRRWEEAHNGSLCVVERVRDKYLMPRIQAFLADMAEHSAQCEAKRQS